MADWASARKGRPAMMWGFHSGDARQHAARVLDERLEDGCTASASSKFAPPQRTPAGPDDVHGAGL